MTRELYSGVTEQRKASIHRFEDAQALFREGRWRGAMYLAGYAVECRLKSKLMQMFSCFHLSELEEELERRRIVHSPYTHSLAALLQITGGRDRLRQNVAAWQDFVVVNRWLPAWRYNSTLANAAEAESFLDAVQRAIQWIDTNLGV